MEDQFYKFFPNASQGLNAGLEANDEAEDQHAWAWALANVWLSTLGQRHVHLNLQLLEGQLDWEWEWDYDNNNKKYYKRMGKIGAGWGGPGSINSDCHVRKLRT